MEEENRTNIFDLNDNCLIQIFDHLDDVDLVKVKRIDKQSYFDSALRHVIKTSLFSFDLSCGDENAYHPKMKRVFEFLELFGNYVTKMSVDCEVYLDFEEVRPALSVMSAYLETLIERFCGQAQFQYCNFYSFQLRENFFKDNESKFKSLKELHIGGHSHAANYSWIFDICKKLKVLKLHEVSEDDTIADDLLPKIVSSELEKIEFNILEGFPDAAIINKLPKNYTVRTIILDHLDKSTNLFLTRFPKLETLKFSTISCFEGFQPSDLITQSPQIEHLIIGRGGYKNKSIRKLLLAAGRQNKLKTLRLIEKNSFNDEILVDEGVEGLLKMTNLEHLTLSVSYKFGQHLNELSRRLKKLNQFEFQCKSDNAYTLDAQLKDQLLDFVKNAKKLTVVKFEFRLDGFDSEGFYESLINNRTVQRNKGSILYVTIYDAVRRHYVFTDMKDSTLETWQRDEFVKMKIYRKSSN